MNVLDFTARKRKQQKISMITCYDYTFAKIIAKTKIDCVLIGDSAAMVMHGHATTIPATVACLAQHTKAVKLGVADKFLIVDMPFLSCRKGLVNAMHAVEKLMRAGANAVKIEGVAGNEAIIKHIVDSGIPVMGHLGLTPQSVHQFGGFKVQGKTTIQANYILEQAKTLENLGAFAVVLECVPAELAKHITFALNIATIGIGAGADVDGQVLVLQDALGLSLDFSPKFSKQYLNGATLIKAALDHYAAEVTHLDFPGKEHSF